MVRRAPPSWSPQQDAALKAASAWLRTDKKVFRLFGFAGTGKTTLARHLAGEVGNVVYGAFTGKAADVMRKAGCAGAATLHSMLYRPLEPDEAPDPWRGRFAMEGGSGGRVRESKLLIVDEVSMVNGYMGLDLCSVANKILVLGDPFQLPPVKGGGFFTANEPDILLTEVHRQAKDSPIVHMATAVREGRGLEQGRFGTSAVIARKDLITDEVTVADQVIVGRNDTRTAYNRRLRQLYGRKTFLPEVDDRLMCTKNGGGLFNGQLLDVAGVRRGRKGVLVLDLLTDSDRLIENVKTHEAFFIGDPNTDLDWKVRRELAEFTFGYAITCHKAQGSQWPNVMLFDESFAFREHRARWLYTAITRASERLTVVR